MDKGTNHVVREYKGHNQATNTMLTGVGHFLAGDAQFNQSAAMMGYFLPKYISLGTMGLISQDEDSSHLPIGISGAGLPETADEATRYVAYMEQSPGYGADGYPNGNNNNRPALGLGPKFNGEAVGCELISNSFPRAKITHREVIPETNAENPETVDVVLSAMISTGALAQFRNENGYIFITEAGLWSQSKYSENGTSLLAGYRIKPPDEDNWDMTNAQNRHILQENIIRVGINQVVQVVWKVQIGSVSTHSVTYSLGNVPVNSSLVLNSAGLSIAAIAEKCHIDTTLTSDNFEQGDLSSGQPVSSSNYIRSNAFIDVPSGSAALGLSITVNTGKTLRYWMYCYDSSENYVRVSSATTNGELCDVSLSGVGKIKIVIGYTNTSTCTPEDIETAIYSRYY